MINSLVSSRLHRRESKKRILEKEAAVEALQMRILAAPFILHSSMASSTMNDDDFLMREIMLTHDPDDRCHLDSSLLLSLVEATLTCSGDKATVLDQELDITDIDLSASEAEPTSRVIYKISHEVVWFQPCRTPSCLISSPML